MKHTNAARDRIRAHVRSLPWKDGVTPSDDEVEGFTHFIEWNVLATMFLQMAMKPEGAKSLVRGLDLLNMLQVDVGKTGCDLFRAFRDDLVEHDITKLIDDTKTPPPATGT